MKISKIAEAMEYIDEDLVCEATLCVAKKKPREWIRWSAIAAGLLVLLAAGGIVLHSLLPAKNPQNRYKDHQLMTGEYGIVWPWEHKTVFEKYVSVEVDGVEFVAKRRAISEQYIGELLGRFSATGYDDIEGGAHHASFEAYAIEGVSSQKLIALKMEGKYYVFLSKLYAPPATLGDLLECYSLDRTVTLSRFSVMGEGEVQYRILQDDAPIWQELRACKDAPSADAYGWHEVQRKYLSFTVSSEQLGVYKLALHITEDGYLWSNLFYGEHLYFIGESAAGRIIAYAEGNSHEADFEPYYRTVTGKITQITEEAIFVDDSVLCTDPKDGIVYRIPCEDPSIRRYVTCGILAVGGTVQVSYTGEIDAQNTVHGVHAFAEAIILEDGVAIPE